MSEPMIMGSVIPDKVEPFKHLTHKEWDELMKATQPIRDEVAKITNSISEWMYERIDAEIVLTLKAMYPESFKRLSKLISLIESGDKNV